MQELPSHALSICEALKELEYWGSKGDFNLSSFEDSQHCTVQIIRGRSYIVQEVCTSLCEGWKMEWVRLSTYMVAAVLC